MPIETPANAMFRRITDVFIQTRLGKRPLDVGADRIARTAYAALAILAILRVELGIPIPLAWTPGLVRRPRSRRGNGAQLRRNTFGYLL